MAIMFTGVAVLAVFAGSLAQFFNLGKGDKPAETAASPGDPAGFVLKS